MAEQVFAIDPGTTSSALVVMRGMDIERAEIIGNAQMVRRLQLASGNCHLAIEMVACYGMPVGFETFETCVWIGRFVQAFGGPFTFVYRKKSDQCASVCSHICKNNNARDPHIRQALIDRYPPTGGGKTPQIGTQVEPGPLRGLTSHMWSALAVGLTWQETYAPRESERVLTTH